MFIDGIRSQITCGGGNKRGNCGGDGKTATCKGKVGGPHKGNVVKRGVRIENCAGMGDSGGGKVFHLGSLTQDVSCGCIHVDVASLRKLETECKDAALNISGNGGSTKAVKNRKGRDGGYKAGFKGRSSYVDEAKPLPPNSKPQPPAPSGGPPAAAPATK